MSRCRHCSTRSCLVVLRKQQILLKVWSHGIVRWITIMTYSISYSIYKSVHLIFYLSYIPHHQGNYIHLIVERLVALLLAHNLKSNFLLYFPQTQQGQSFICFVISNRVFIWINPAIEFANRRFSKLT